MRRLMSPGVIPATAIGLILTVGGLVPCLAQGTVPPSPPAGPRAGSVASPQAPPARRWEIEGYGGFSGATSASSGSAALPEQLRRLGVRRDQTNPGGLR